MKKHILIPLVVIFMSVLGCTKPEDGGQDNPQPPAPPQEQITIPSTVDVTPVVPPEGGDSKISFTAAATWTASVISTKADSWVDVNPKSGNPGPAEIKITTTPNDTYVERNATIRIECGDDAREILLTQKQSVDFIDSINNLGIYVLNESSIEPFLVPSPDNHLQIGFIRDVGKNTNTFRVQSWIGNAFCVQISYPAGKNVGETVNIELNILGSVNGIQSEKNNKITIEKIENGKIWMRGDKFCFIVKE